MSERLVPPGQPGPAKAGDTLMREHDRPGSSSKERGYSYAGKKRTAYLPGALPGTWDPGDPKPTRGPDGVDAPSLDPHVGAGPDEGHERLTDGDDNAGSPLEHMADPNITPGETDDPERGRFRGPPWPDRRRDPYGWEMFFRNLMRQSPFAMRQTPWTLAQAMVGTSSVCRWDGVEFAQAATGRPREYCSDRCKQAAYNDKRKRSVTERGKELEGPR